MMQDRQIDVVDQVSLSFTKTLSLCVSGIRHRLLRSVLTLAVIVLAVAFFMSLLSENTFLLTVRGVVQTQIAQVRESDHVLARLYGNVGGLELSRTLAASGPEVADELARVTGLSADYLAQVAKTCVVEQRYYRFFDKIKTGQRLALIEKRSGQQIFMTMGADGELDGFLKRLLPMRNLRLPATEAEFREFVASFGGHRNELQAVADKWNAAVDAVDRGTKELIGATPVKSWLVDADDAQLKRWVALVSDAGFSLDIEQATRIAGGCRTDVELAAIAKALSEDERKRLWKREFNELPELDKMMMKMGDKRAVPALGDLHNAEKLQFLGETYRHRRRISDAEKALKARVDLDQTSGLTSRQAFLLVVSFLVCTIGIANAMLMSITERFREIATMKCLGATDGFIMVQFVLEAGIQGVAGGLLGMVVGLLLAIGKSTLIFGRFVFDGFPLVLTVMNCVYALAAGLVLAMLAALYPSWAASRMAPMEAMGVE
jgi:hypothetical protein